MKSPYNCFFQKTYLILFLLIISCNLFLNAQVIYLSSTDNEIFRLNLSTCEYDFVVDVQEQVYDISFHPNGTLYGIAGNGDFYEIDTLSGATTFVNNFDIGFFSTSIYNSLTISGDGTVYATGTNGELWSFNIDTNTEIELGEIGFSATGDLTFIDGSLYAAVDGDRIVLVDINNPSNSSVVLNENIEGEIFGIVSFAEDCSDVNTYALSDGNSSIYQINLEANSLGFICQLDFEVGGGASTFEFLASDPIVIEDVNETSPDCGEENGSISVNITGGIGQIDYSIDGLNFQSSSTFNELPEGNYTLTVSDENGCIVTQDVELLTEEGVQIVDLLVANISCESTNSSLTIIAAGGAGQLEYSIDGLNFQDTGFFDNLSPAAYTVTVQDMSNCVITEDIEIGVTDLISLSLVQQTTTSCNPDNGTLELTGIGGTPPYQYSINGIDFQSSGFYDSLSEGNYTVFIEDVAGCTSSANYMIEAVLPTVILNVEQENSSCGEENAMIIVEATGGSGVLQYSVDGDNFQLSETFENLSAGEYTVFVRDDNGCVITNEVELDNSFPIEVNDVEMVPASCNGSEGEILLEVSGGTGQLVASLDSGYIQADYFFNNLSSGEYTIIVSDEVGCSLDTLIFLPQVGCTIYIPNVFSPDRDGVNDIFKIFPYRNFEEQFTAFRIFNRWGALVYEALNFNPTNTGWNGKFRGQDAPIGVYVYAVELLSPKGETKILKGDFTLVR